MTQRSQNWAEQGNEIWKILPGTHPLQLIVTARGGVHIAVARGPIVDDIQCISADSCAIAGLECQINRLHRELEVLRKKGKRYFASAEWRNLTRWPDLVHTKM